jgi:hypothetical protein
MVLVEMDSDPDHALLRHMDGDVAGASGYAWRPRAATIADPSRHTDFWAWRWPVRVAEVVGPTTVRVEQPLKLPIDSSQKARFRDLAPTIHDSGVEDLARQPDRGLRTGGVHGARRTGKLPARPQRGRLVQRERLPARGPPRRHLRLSPVAALRKPSHGDIRDQQGRRPLRAEYFTGWRPHTPWLRGARG